MATTTNQKGRISGWNVLACVGLFALGIAVAIYMQQGRIKPVGLVTLGGDLMVVPPLYHMCTLS